MKWSFEWFSLNTSRQTLPRNHYRDNSFWSKRELIQVMYKNMVIWYDDKQFLSKSLNSASLHGRTIIAFVCS